MTRPGLGRSDPSREIHQLLDQTHGSGYDPQSALVCLVLCAYDVIVRRDYRRLRLLQVWLRRGDIWSPSGGDLLKTKQEVLAGRC